MSYSKRPHRTGVGANTVTLSTYLSIYLDSRRLERVGAALSVFFLFSFSLFQISDLGFLVITTVE